MRTECLNNNLVRNAHPTKTMKYKTLGNTDIKVSEICLGTMTWGEQNTVNEAFAQMDYALDQGVNFFDAAEMYPVPPKPETQGLTETYIGQWFAKTGKRDQVILATKVAGRGEGNSGVNHVRNGPRLNRQQILEAIDTSLQRLQTDYVDLYQVHWPERSTNFFGQFGYTHVDNDGVPIQETLEALGEVVKSGKARAIGLSNETPWGVMEYLRLSKELNLPRVVSIQNPYNLLNRSFEVGLAEMAIREQVGLLAYSPLAFGVLSGKYLHNQKPNGARLTLYTRFARYLNPYATAATQAYADLAQTHGLNMAQMALAFINRRQFVTSNIIGATNLEQLKKNIDSANVELTDEVLKAIDDINHQYRIPAP